MLYLGILLPIHLSDYGRTLKFCLGLRLEMTLQPIPAMYSLPCPLAIITCIFDGARGIHDRYLDSLASSRGKVAV